MCTKAFYNTESGASKVYKEKIHMRLEKLLGLGAVFVALAVAASSQMGPVGVAQADCTVTVKPGEFIQRAIDGAKAGAVVCLTAGEWEENIVIEKSLTLRGEKEKTVIDGVREGYPVVWLRTPEEQEVVVQLEGLRISGAEGRCADPPACADRVLLQGSVQGTISGSTLSGNGWGIGLWDSAQADHLRLHSLRKRIGHLALGLGPGDHHQLHSLREQG
jgi:nitrous oxidase accessory protein NosD